MCAPRGQSWDEDQIGKYGLAAHIEMVTELNGYGRSYWKRRELLKELGALLEQQKAQIS